MTTAKPDFLPPVACDVHSYLLEDELLLFSESAQTMYRLNSSAAFIWCCLEEGLDRQRIIHELVRTFDLSDSAAATDLDALLARWQTLGVLGHRGESEQARPVTEQETPSATDLPMPRSRVHDYPAECRYRMLETVIRIRFSEPDMKPLADAAFAHLRVGVDQSFDLGIDLQRDSTGYFLFANNELIAHCATAQEVPPLLHGEAVSDAYSRVDCLLAIHAAAVSNGDECIVLPAVSGSGKSTLTAALIAAGFKYCSDELVLLGHHTHTVQAIPAAIGTKAGAWPVLQALYPSLNDLPVFLRQDKQLVRYLLPARHMLPNDSAKSWPLSCLVFPKYQTNAGISFDRLSPADALCRLMEAGCDMEGGLDADRTTELVDWIKGIPCFELRFDDLQKAVCRIAGLLP